MEKKDVPPSYDTAMNPSAPQGYTPYYGYDSSTSAPPVSNPSGPQPYAEKISDQSGQAYPPQPQMPMPSPAQAYPQPQMTVPSSQAYPQPQMTVPSSQAYPQPQMTTPGQVYPQQPAVQQPLIIQQPMVQPYGQPVIMQPGMQPMCTTTTVYPAQFSNIGTGPNSLAMTCPYCNRNIETVTKKSPSPLAYISSIMMCIVGLVFGCCLIPFFIESCKDTEHTCPECSRILSKYSPTSSMMSPSYGHGYNNRRRW